MTKEAKRELWVARMEGFSATGQTQRQWCLENGVPPAQFSYWRRVLKLNGESVPAAGPPAGWCQVPLAERAVPAIESGTRLTVLVGSARIVVNRGFDNQLLRQVVAALAEGGAVSC